MLSYNIKIGDKKEIIVANKMDLDGSEEGLKRIKEVLGDKAEDIIEMSAATTEGIDKLKYRIWDILKDAEFEYETFDEEYIPFEDVEEPDFEVTINNDNVYIVTGPLIDDLVYRTNFQDNEALRHFQKVLEDKKVFEKLKKMGISDGDTVIVGEMEFDYFK